MTTRPWRPISPLTAQPPHEFSQDDDLHRQWINHRAHIDQAGVTLQQFEQQLHRSWAIKTGSIEGLYRLDEAQTRILIETGFERFAVPRAAPARTLTPCWPSYGTT